MHITLEPIIDVPSDWETAHTIRVLVIDNRSEALADLLELKKKHLNDYKKLLQIIRLVACNERVINPLHVKPDAQRSGIYEMRAGSARLFFFYARAAVVVCTNVYWKAKASAREQNLAFEKARRLRDIYIRNAHAIE